MPPHAVLPKFPTGYLTEPQPRLNWLDVSQQFAHAKDYWLVTVRPNGRPHTVPKWGVWLDERFYFDGSPQTCHARNLLSNSAVCVHTERGEQLFTLEGFAAALLHPAPELTAQIAAAYTVQYAPKCRMGTHRSLTNGMIAVCIGLCRDRYLHGMD